jgi:CheY-like chemotaxis protein
MSSRSKLQVLLVDDDDAIRESFAMLLTAYDYEVRTADNGVAGLALLREALPDIVISDLQMPIMSGYEFLAEVRRQFPRVPRVAMSGSHAGSEVPPGVIANAFFGKGGDILNLLDIVADLADADSAMPRAA